MNKIALYAVGLVLCCLQCSVIGLSLAGKSWPAVPPADVELLEGYDGGRTSDSVLETHSISGRGFLKTIRNRRRVSDSESVILYIHICIHNR